MIHIYNVLIDLWYCSITLVVFQLLDNLARCRNPFRKSEVILVKIECVSYISIQLAGAYTVVFTILFYPNPAELLLHKKDLSIIFSLGSHLTYIGVFVKEIVKTSLVACMFVFEQADRNGFGLTKKHLKKKKIHRVLIA